MINTLELWRAALAQIGAEGTQRYTIQRDGIYAVNGAQKRLEALIGSVLANNKGSEESLSELQETRVMQTNQYGGIALDAIQPALTYQIWTVLGLYAEPSVNLPNPVVPIGVGQNTYIRNDLVYTPGGTEERPVQRMTMEQVAKATRNRFMSGSPKVAATPLRTYGYYIMGNRGGFPSDIVGDREVVITPASISGRKLFAMSYLRSPDAITSIDANTNIPFPSSLFIVMRDLVQNELSVKQGNNTTLYTVTEKEIARLLIAQN